MATLLELMQQRLAGQGETPPAQPQAPNLAEILAAKKGKAQQAPAAPGGGNLEVDISRGIGNAQVAQQQQQGQQAAAQLGLQAAEVEQKQQLGQEQLASQQRQADSAMAQAALRQRQDVQATESLAQTQRQAGENLKAKAIADNATLTLANLASERNISRDNLFSMARMENAELASRKDAASLSQKAFLLAMSDSAYVEELMRIGDERKLKDQIAFEREASSVTFGQEMHKMLESFGFQAGQSAKDRDAREQIARMSNAQVIQLADLAARQANLQAIYKGVGDTTTGAIDAYDKFTKNKTTTVQQPSAVPMRPTAGIDPKYFNTDEV